MAITAVDKIRINKYLNECGLVALSYFDMCEYLGKRVKISDAEFIEYFTDTVIDGFRKNEKISVKKIIKIILIIQSFLVWMNESGAEIKEDILDKIRSFKELYDDYLNRTGFEKNKELYDDYIGDIMETVNELYPSEIKNESIVNYISRIAQLEEDVRRLKKELAEITRLYDNLQGSYNEKSSKFIILNEDVNSLSSEVRSKNNQIARLNDRINELENLLSEIKSDNELLESYKAQYEVLTHEVESLRKIIEDDIAEKENASNLKNKQEKIEALIYQKLLFEKSNIDEILKYVIGKGFVSDRNEISNLLKKIKSRINVDSSSFALSPQYKVVAPRILEDQQFMIDIPKGCKHYDIMLVSDFHIKEFNNKVLEGFYMLDDYCVENGIHLILNLGDFYHGIGGKTLNYDSAIKNYKVIEQAISQIPKADGVYHAILGGNHDRNIIQYGFDSIDILSNEREDIINLGYTHSNIVLNGASDTLGSFDIHHPDTFDFPVNLDDMGIDIAAMDNYLNRIYNNQERSRDSSYIDIFGHTHRSQFNYLSSYCYVAPFFGPKERRGATHLRIYFDENTKIKYMVFMPLNIGSKLVKNNEIIYQKVLSK